MKPNLANERFFLGLIKAEKLKVTKAGRAWNLITGKELSKERAKSIDVYRKLSWLNPKTGKIVQVQLHRIVWAATKGLPKPDIVLNHKDGNKQNCRLSNLELVSSMRNNQHAVQNSLVYFPKGEERVNAKFTDAEVASYRKAYALGLCTKTQIKTAKACSFSVVGLMLSGKTYAHVVTKYDSKCK